MTIKRRFTSIQTIESGGSVALIALADDGTAWTARTQSISGYMNNVDLVWKPIDPLPDVQPAGSVASDSDGH